MLGASVERALMHDISRLGDLRESGSEFEQTEAMEEHWRRAFLERMVSQAASASGCGHEPTRAPVGIKTSHHSSF